MARVTIKIESDDGIYHQILFKDLYSEQAKDVIKLGPDIIIDKIKEFEKMESSYKSSGSGGSILDKREDDDNNWFFPPAV